MRSLREQVRALLVTRIDHQPAPSGALAAVNEALTRVPTAASLHWDPIRGLCRSAPHPADQIIDHALGVLAANAADLLTGVDAEPRRSRLCPLYRYLLRAGRRHWCSVRCGDRARTPANPACWRLSNADGEAAVADVAGLAGAAVAGGWVRAELVTQFPVPTGGLVGADAGVVSGAAGIHRLGTSPPPTGTSSSIQRSSMPDRGTARLPRPRNFGCRSALRRRTDRAYGCLLRIQKRRTKG
ncbi:ABATE domain-containing protein [Streptomyces violaceusniger]|uniref:ABATE domain-containing protein n=1 Tax=Streptomyces violaceusniger TaxID=68280 RepID=UPI003682CC7E